MAAEAARDPEEDGEEEAEFDRFLYLITHDLRACFRALKTIPEWIREDLAAVPAPPEIADHLDMLVTQALRGDRMLLDLREFSRVGRLCGPVVTEDIRTIAARCWAALPPPPDMTLDLSAAEGSLTLPQEDAARLFSALLGNAVKHRDTSDGYVAVRSAAGALTTIRIEDDGPGIAPEYRDKAFDLLSTLKPRDSCEGSGVGLALARRIVTGAGGEIALHDRPEGRGLRVEIRLPASGVPS